MNSMLQQLYHVPAFRYQLLQADDGAASDWKENKGRIIDDNILHQLQRLFGHLELSKQVEYNPIEFCFSFKETDGSPTNTSVQHDTEEFFNIIFDRIENLLSQPLRSTCYHQFLEIRTARKWCARNAALFETDSKTFIICHLLSRSVKVLNKVSERILKEKSFQITNVPDARRRSTSQSKH